jgi:pimeloyl-ACP methyl ester carboxylesterase
MHTPTSSQRCQPGLGSAPATRMLPVSFDGCFGWLHPASDGRGSRVGVLLCQGLKSDALTGYRSFRLLANALAKEGYPTLRFDYPGTGDSCDPDAAEHWTAWRQSIHSAVDWLRHHTGADQVALCGLRFGATLAAVVTAERIDVPGLILLAPVLRGRSYIRQLRMEAHNQPSTAPDKASLVSHELRLSAETVRLISQVDLRRVVLAQGCRLAVYYQAMSPVLAECMECWRSRGTEVACNDFAGLEPLLRPSPWIHEASADVSRIVAWMRASVRADSAPPRVLSMTRGAELRPSGCIETPLQFGVDGNLFGMLCRPAGQTAADLAVIMGNSAGDPHYGGARASVNLARWLGAEGITSLRIDFAGLGDSVASDDVETHVLETDRRSDISASIDALEALGHRRFAAYGLCTGAFHAFHSALTDSRISALLLVNPPLFQWHTSQRIEFLSYSALTMSQFLQRLRPSTIRRIGLAGLRARFPMVRASLVSNAAAALRRLAKPLGFATPKSFTQASIERLSQRVRMLFLFSEGDEGIAVLDREFGQGAMPQGVSVQIVPRLDHALTGRDMQRIAAEHFVAFLSAGLLDSRTPDEAVLALVSRVGSSS